MGNSQKAKSIFSENRYVLFDGGMGTMLQRNDIPAGEIPETWNLTHPEVIKGIHRAYVEAGSEVISTNTFGANRRKLSGTISVKDAITSAVKLAKESGARFVAQDIGPTGALLKPLGTLSFDEAYELFREQIVIGAEAGADIILIETMTDLLEIKAAVLAAKENCSLPVIASMSFGEDGRTFLGTSPRIAALTLCDLGIDAIGINCSLGPKELLPLVKELTGYSTVPVIIQANAGLPKIIGGNTVYTISPEEYCSYVSDMLDMGISLIGGCCGTTPDYISSLKELVAGRIPVKRSISLPTAVTSAQNFTAIDSRISVIGERINPTGKKWVSAALREENYGILVEEALKQQEAGADILDVNVGLPDIDEKSAILHVINDIQAVCPLPLQIDSSDTSALEAAVRHYNGKPLINSVNGKQDSLEAVLPIVKKYGAVVVGLTLDEGGIPATAEERLRIAEKIMNAALTYGIPKRNIVIDTLVLTASTNQDMALETVKTISLVREKLGLSTVLGVSNISFGLPNREIMNSVFLSAAFSAGLNLPIIDPLKERYIQTVKSYKVLNGEDEGSAEYIEYMASHPLNVQVTAGGSTFDSGNGAVQQLPTDILNNGVRLGAGVGISESTVDSSATGTVSYLTGPADSNLRSIIVRGRKGLIRDAIIKALESKNVMEIINNEFIPALDEVGVLFEQKKLFLPQLMASAETVKSGFDILKATSGDSYKQDKLTIVLATVKGDIHDIGKNIVKMLLENYGYGVIDLGRDVEPELIVRTVLEKKIKLVGLSALMTTTVKNMAETIRCLREAGAECKIMVGGAVLNEEYAKMVGADFYAKDAAESARIAAGI